MYRSFIGIVLQKTGYSAKLNKILNDCEVIVLKFADAEGDEMNVALVKVIFLAHVAATLFMCGVIWFVQVVHYPLFESVGKDKFDAYQAAHRDLIFWVVVPPMLIEGLTAVLLLWQRPQGVEAKFLWTGLVLLAIIWLSTWFLQMPQHNRLIQGFDQHALRILVLSNWIRAFGWSARSVLVLFMLALHILLFGGGFDNQYTSFACQTLYLHPNLCDINGAQLSVCFGVLDSRKGIISQVREVCPPTRRGGHNVPHIMLISGRFTGQTKKDTTIGIQGCNIKMFFVLNAFDKIWAIAIPPIH